MEEEISSALFIILVRQDTSRSLGVTSTRANTKQGVPLPGDSPRGLASGEEIVTA